ncbi:MAG: hypothetical protein EPO22_11760, partial [Dehalococcoidia bacterium]
MAEPITTNTTVREAVARYAGIEKIFDAHGLTGCGGPDGPAEPIGFFAAIHHVEPQQLVAELNEYAAAQQVAKANRAAIDPGRHTYPLFLTTALVIALSTGITSGIAAAMTGGGWGALRGEAWLAMVQTHGHVQIFGYLMLFVMGIALHILPRFKGQAPPSRWLMLATYWTMLAGVFLRASAQPHGQGFVRWLLGASAILELVGIVLFAAIVAVVFWRAREKREPYDRFLEAATAWLVALGGMNAYLTLRAAIDGERVLNGAGDAALLESAIYGFVVLFILGVSYRALPFFLSLRPAYGRLRDAGLAAIVVALPLRVAAVWAPQFGRYGWTERTDQLSTFVLAIGVAAAAIALRVFESPDPGRPEVESPPAFRPMVQTAYGWLLAGVALDVYWRLRELEGGFTPYYAAGAIRHAFLLGFATLMLMAMTYRTVPVFSGRALRWPAAVPVSFVMVASAAVLRVFPVAFTPAPSKLDFKLLTAGGVLLFFGLGIFFVELMSSMFARFAGSAARAASAEGAAAAVPAASSTVRFGQMRHEAENGARPQKAAAPPATPRPAGPARRDTTVADAIELSPRVLQVLLDYGFGPL